MFVAVAVALERRPDPYPVPGTRYPVPGPRVGYSGSLMGTLFSELGPLRAEKAQGPLIYADANIPAPLVGFMRDRLRWDVLHVVDEPDWRRATDLAHFVRARDLHRTLLTLDHDFLDHRRFPPADGPGVIVLSAPDERGLRKLLAEVDTYLRERAADAPLRGRTLSLQPGWIARRRAN